VDEVAGMTDEKAEDPAHNKDYGNQIKNTFHGICCLGCVNDDSCGRERVCAGDPLLMRCWYFCQLLGQLGKGYFKFCPFP